MMGKTFLGKYEVQRLLGEGGMGRVYLARQIDLQRQVVVKVMHEHVAADAKFRERFQREMLLMARFQHPYAVTLYDATLDSAEGPCIIMEYVRGETLDIVLARNQRLSPVRIGRILGQLCEVLQAAHSLGIMHRDLKPANLMILDADSPYEKIKVMDFGLAKLADRRPARALTDSGAEFAIGTPAYMCPEQAKGDDVDFRGDFYSVGVMLYELLTGRLPFNGLSTMDMLLAHATESPPKMSEVCEVWVPPAIEKVVAWCLEKQPGNRPTSARELAQRYDEALQAQDASSKDESAEQAEQPMDIPLQPPVLDPSDPSAVVYQFQAWMPESVAAYKLHGFVQDAGGVVTENVPGRIRVRLGGKGSVYESKRGALSWLLGTSKHPIELELQMQHTTTAKMQNNLTLTVILRYLGRNLDSDWRARCNQIYIDLRSYLMGSTGSSTINP